MAPSMPPRNRRGATALAREPSAVSPDDVDDARPLSPPPLVLKDVSEDARLHAVFDPGKGVEAKKEQALSVPIAHGPREEVTEEGEPVVRPGAETVAGRRESREGSQIGAVVVFWECESRINRSFELDGEAAR